MYGGFPFVVGVSPQELLRHREEYATDLNREAFSLCWVVLSQIVFVIYKGLTGHSWLVPHCLALNF